MWLLCADFNPILQHIEITKDCKFELRGHPRQKVKVHKPHFYRFVHVKMALSSWT